jgi:hypothetical protein
MLSLAGGSAVAAELLGTTSPFRRTPYRLERFVSGVVFPEALVL